MSYDPEDDEDELPEVIEIEPSIVVKPCGYARKRKTINC
jgi:hypothetical protein